VEPRVCDAVMELHPSADASQPPLAATAEGESCQGCENQQTLQVHKATARDENPTPRLGWHMR